MDNDEQMQMEPMQTEPMTEQAPPKKTLAKLLPTLLLAAVGLAFVFWNIYVIVSHMNAGIVSLKSPIVFIITGILLVAFAIFYARNEDNQYREDDDEDDDDIGIIYEYDDDYEDEDRYEDEDKYEDKDRYEEEEDGNEDEYEKERGLNK